jgi:hypothetical protein
MIYYAVLKGGDEGCDYTIGCNMVYKKLQAYNCKEAKEELQHMYEDYGADEKEGGWKEIILLEVSKEIHKIIPIPSKLWGDE